MRQVGVASMRQRKALGWLSLAMAASFTAGCAQVVGSYGPLEAQPHHVEASRALAADWDRQAAPRPSRLTRVAATSPRVAASSAPRPAEPLPAATDNGPKTVIPSSVLWPKEPWEVELDKVVRNICHGC